MFLIWGARENCSKPWKNSAMRRDCFGRHMGWRNWRKSSQKELDTNRRDLQELNRYDTADLQEKGTDWSRKGKGADWPSPRWRNTTHSDESRKHSKSAGRHEIQTEGV